jgi:uncharacterized protein YbaR (Trm112 family)
MIACPYCGKDVTIPCEAQLNTMEIGQHVCEHCGREFLMIDNMPTMEDRPTGK